MSAKLSFQDIYNNELGTDKLNFGSFTVSLSVAAGVPTADSSVGALQVDSTSGSVYRKTASGGSNWIQIGSITTTILINKFPTIQINSAVTSTDGSGPSIGDLVGIYGSGAWTLSGNLTISRANMAGCGSANAALISVGSASSTLAEVFNGLAWIATGAQSVSKTNAIAVGAQNSALVAAGFTNAVNRNTEVFNGSTWAVSGNLNTAKHFAAGAGTSYAALIAGGATDLTTPTNQTELFNGSIWVAGATLNAVKLGVGGCGAQYSAIVAGGANASAQISSTEMFNGTTWIIASALSGTRSETAPCGSQGSALIAGGLTGAAGTYAFSSEMFNGSAWSAGGALNAARKDVASGGAQNAGLIAGGANAATLLTTETYAQSTYRKLFSREYNTVKNIGILLNSNTVLLQGSTITSTFYVANKYLVTNRMLNAQLTNNTALTSVAFASVTGPSSNIMTYNLSTTANMLSLIPGMQVVVATGGANPVDATNVGTFLINRIINPTSIEVVNATGTTQNPGTGTLSFLTSMIAVDNILPGDIIVGKTDVNGILTIHKPIVISSLNRRLK